jgi:hypothetical protein
LRPPPLPLLDRFFVLHAAGAGLPFRPGFGCGLLSVDFDPIQLCLPGTLVRGGPQRRDGRHQFSGVRRSVGLLR